MSRPFPRMKPLPPFGHWPTEEDIIEHDRRRTRQFNLYSRIELNVSATRRARASRYRAAHERGKKTPWPMEGWDRSRNP